MTKYVVENGFAAWSKWHITNMWYPFGRNAATSSFPGVPFSGAFFYYIISGLGFSVTVQDVCIMFPVIMAAITVVVVYYFGKEIGGKPVGLLAALFLALSPAYIGRTILGFFFMFLIYIGMVGTGQHLISSMIEEKGSRVIV
jgi:asparagine N-glycosylation enzyme membrane subunit Stt3